MNCGSMDLGRYCNAMGFVKRRRRPVHYIPGWRKKVLFELICEAFAKEGKCLVHLVFHGLNGDIKRAGDLAVRKTVISAQNEYCPAPFREDGKALLQSVRGQRAVVGVRGVVGEADKYVFSQVRLPPGTFLVPGMVESKVPGYPIQVDLRSEIRLNPFPRLPETDECLLREVVGCFAVPCISIEEAEDLRVESLEESLESGCIA